MCRNVPYFQEERDKVDPVQALQQRASVWYFILCGIRGVVDSSHQRGLYSGAESELYLLVPFQIISKYSGPPNL